MDDLIIIFLASFLVYFMMIGLVVLWFIDGKIKKEQVIHALFAVFVAWIVSVAIKYLFPTLRPFMINGGETDVLILPLDGAFPSGHTAEAFALAVTVFMHDRKVGFWFLAFALAVGVGRMLANVHYPVDIVGGAFLGTIIAVIVEKTHFARFINNLTSKRKK